MVVLEILALLYLTNVTLPRHAPSSALAAQLCLPAVDLIKYEIHLGSLCAQPSTFLHTPKAPSVNPGFMKSKAEHSRARISLPVSIAFKLQVFSSCISTSFFPPHV